MSAEQKPLDQEKEYHYGLRTVMELFDIGPTVAITVLSVSLLIIIAGLVAFIRSAPPSTLTISSGPPDSYFHKTAQRYAKRLEKSGVKVEVLTSNGSLENLARLSDPKAKVDLAIVQGGLSGKEYNFEEMVSLGSITNQPMLVFYRGKNIELLSELAGKTIAVGMEGSGTRKLALRLLSVNGIKEESLGKTKLLNMDADAAAIALEKKEIDAAFIMSENASYGDIRKMLRSEGIKLMSFKQAAAYVRKVDYLNIFELPQGSVDLGLNIPAQDVTLIGPMVELVASYNLHPALSDLVLDAATQVHGRASLFQKRGEFPTPIEHSITLSEDATRFYKSGKSFLYRYLSFWLANLLSRFVIVLLPILILLIPAVRMVPAFFRWRARIKIRSRYRELLQIEQRFRHETDPARLAYLKRSFERIDTEIGKMRVRAAFADQFYILRGHIDYVRSLMNKDGKIERPLTTL